MSPYPLLTERDGDSIIWRPKSGELVEGVGRLQAFFEVGTDVIGSSDMISCEVDSSLLGVEPGTDPGQTDLPWELDIIEQIAELSGHYPKIIDGDLYIWDSTLNDWVEFEASGGGAVDSVNGKTGVVVLDASDVGALPDDTPIPAAVTEQTVAGWGFTKNTGTYSKPSGGIPKTDLASAVQTTLGKADTALQTAPVTSVNNKTGAVTLGASDVHALPDSTVIPPTVTEQTVAGWGFTKNTGTYVKPSTGIPASDLAQAVQTSLGKADTALQQHQSLAAYRTASAQDAIDAVQDAAIAAKYTKPGGGIPKSDLASDVQTSLGKADTALQSHQSLSGYATEQWVENKGYLTLADLPVYNGGVA